MFIIYAYVYIKNLKVRLIIKPFLLQVLISLKYAWSKKVNNIIQMLVFMLLKLKVIERNLVYYMPGKGWFFFFKSSIKGKKATILVAFTSWGFGVLEIRVRVSTYSEPHSGLVSCERFCLRCVHYTNTKKAVVYWLLVIR